MRICFIPNLGEKRASNEPLWGADFFALAFKKYMPYDVSIEYNLNNINQYDLVWVHNIANMLRGLNGRINSLRILSKNKTPIIGGVRGEVGFNICKNYLRFFDAIHTSNQKITDMVKPYNSNVLTLPSGVEPSWYKEHTSPCLFVAGWAGDTSKTMKNTQILTSLSVPILFATKQNYIPNEQMPEKFYNKISVLIHPSSHEGSCRVITEAAACGLPIICTNVGHNDTIVSKDWMITLDNPKPQIERLIEKLQDPTISLVVGKENQEKARYYMWSNVISRAKSLVDPLLGVSH